MGAAFLFERLESSASFQGETPAIEQYPGFGIRKIFKGRIVPLKENVGKSKGYWATKKTVNYANENTEVIMYAHAKPGELFINGKYITEVNCDNATVGSTTIDLE